MDFITHLAAVHQRTSSQLAAPGTILPVFLHPSSQAMTVAWYSHLRLFVCTISGATRLEVFPKQALLLQHQCLVPSSSIPSSLSLDYPDLDVGLVRFCLRCFLTERGQRVLRRPATGLFVSVPRFRGVTPADTGTGILTCFPSRFRPRLVADHLPRLTLDRNPGLPAVSGFHRLSCHYVSIRT